ncbi:hypothetical protein COV20_06140 [Candidatus Woesearchaeota archaeon CG10_big_fil_rev_8_21_14_0_10_45_16]|nr:MAG: hypothetical protein COV20_06140 [Candidatus Woesearchaeota archaeon CG10_big_fil_rev_8_21_14_0_10_45_16]
MAEKESSGSSNPLGCLAPAVGIAGLVATLALGPMDLGRSVYNQIIGDTPILKRELLDYTRRDIQRSNPKYTVQQVEGNLANELGYKLEGDKIDPQDVSIEKLWDASEDHARSWYQKWVWPSLDE